MYPTVLSNTAGVSRQPSSRSGAHSYLADELESLLEDSSHGDPALMSGKASESIQIEIEGIVAQPIGRNVSLLAHRTHLYKKAIRELMIGLDDRVLDASCGQGYGSHLLAECAGRVVGLDMNENHLEVARQHFATARLEFETYDTYFQRRRTQVDKLVCIATYETIARDLGLAFLDRLLQQLAEGGDAFLTFPVGNDLPDDYDPRRLNEPSLATMHGLLGPRFARIEYQIEKRDLGGGREEELCVATLFGYRK